MIKRPDRCYRWVIVSEGATPEIAFWDGSLWSTPGDIWMHPYVHKVGIRGTLNKPPIEWQADYAKKIKD